MALKQNFPLLKGYFFGPKSGSKQSVSGYYHTQADGTRGHDGLKAAQTQLKALGYLEGTPDGLYGPDTEQAAKKLQAANRLAADGLIGAATWPYLWAAPAPAPVAKPHKFRVGSLNVQAQQWSGGSYAADAAFIKNTLKPSILAVQEAPNTAALGAQWEFRSYKYLGLLWNPADWLWGGPLVTLSLGTPYHGLVGGLLTSRVNGNTLMAASGHARPNDAIPGSAANKLAGKQSDIRKIISQLKPYRRVVVAGDFSTSAARALFLAAGYTLATPWVDTMDKAGTQRVDQIYVRGLTNGSGSGFAIKTSVSDHHALLATLELPAS